MQWLKSLSLHPYGEFQLINKPRFFSSLSFLFFSSSYEMCGVSISWINPKIRKIKIRDWEMNWKFWKKRMEMGREREGKDWCENYSGENLMSGLLRKKRTDKTFSLSLSLFDHINWNTRIWKCSLVEIVIDWLYVYGKDWINNDQEF